MEIEFPEIDFKGKIKSIQRFKKTIESASQGDRVGMLVNNLNAELVSSSQEKFKLFRLKERSLVIQATSNLATF